MIQGDRERKAIFADVSRLLSPRSIAVVGASDQPGNVGGAAIRFLQKFAAPCSVYPVSRTRETVAGLPCFRTLADLPVTADLAILAVPAASVADVVKQCVAAGLNAGIVWAGGFVEEGETGVARQRDLADLCRRSGFALLGPNCIGIIDSHAPMTASFASMLLEFDRLLPGAISMVSQSGGLATMAQALAQQQGVGFRYMVSTGNEAVLDVADFVHAFADDPCTKVICIYLEGVREGGKFREALSAARAAGKPVVLLKSGASSASAAAAAAHTGALAGEGRVWSAVSRDCAAISVESLEDLLDIALHLSGADLSKRPTNRGVAAITFGGGSGVLSADQCDRAGLSVPPLTDDTRERLKRLVPPLASTRNPVDLTPQAYLDLQWLPRFPEALDVIAADPGIGSVLFQLGPMASGDVAMADMVSAFRDRCPKPVVVAWPLAIAAARARCLSNAVHVYPEYARGVRAIAHLVQHTEGMAAARDRPAPIAFDWATAVPDATSGTVVSEHRCHAILAQAGLNVAAGRIATTEVLAVEAAEALGYPVVIKGVSDAVTHRAAAGLLALSLKSEAEVREACSRLQARAAELSIALDGLYVQRMEIGGTELLVSAFRDPAFGPMLSLGAGGGLTEVIDDVVLVPAPLCERAATEALARLRIVVRRGGLGEGAEPLIAFVTRFAALAAAVPWRRFVLEVNPVIWSPGRAVAVDGLLIVEES